MVIVSDFTSNNGPDPLEAARRSKALTRRSRLSRWGWAPRARGPITETSRCETSSTSPTVFVKNQVEVRGTVVAHGFANQELNVELYVEGQATPVAKTTVKVPEGADSAPITGLKFVPQTPGEKLLTLQVVPKEGEIVVTNNEMSTFVSVLSGGLNVLFLQGSELHF